MNLASPLYFRHASAIIASDTSIPVSRAPLQRRPAASSRRPVPQPTSTTSGRGPARRTERVQRGVVDGLEKHSLEEAAVIAASPSVEEPHWRQANSDLAPVQHGRHPRHVGNWLRQMFIENYRSAELVFGWSFYRQGSSCGRISSADEFFDAALAWFGDPDPRIGTAWEKGERSAKVIAHRRTLLV